GVLMRSSCHRAAFPKTTSRPLRHCMLSAILCAATLGGTASILVSEGPASASVTVSPTLTATGPGSDNPSTLIATTSIGAVLASGTTSPVVTGTITFKVFGPQASAPTTCTSGGTTVGTTAAAAGNGTYRPSAGYTPTS